MSARWFLFCSAAAFVFTARANAAVIVTTNMNGADVEVREEDINPNTNALLGPIGAPFGTNRGANTELAARLKDSTANSGDRTSVMYLKFDISDANGVTDALLGVANRTSLRLTTRNSAQLSWSRIHARNPYYGTLPADNTNPDFVAFASNPANYTRVQFNVLGLQNFAHPNYNWSESGVAATWDPVSSPIYGPSGSLTWYNAPGITPDSRLTPAQDPGKWNFNSDMQLLGQATIEDPGLPYTTPPPFPSVPGAGSAALCVGCNAIDFKDPDGRLHDLIVAARAADQSHITLAVYEAMDAHQNASGETLQVTPNTMLNFNYLFNPKEMDGNFSLAGLQLNTDPSWNPDWTDLVAPAGPDNGLTGPGPNSGANNDDGRFSPQLEFSVDGDFDINGNVDGADFLVWQRGGSPNPGSSADFAAWRANFGFVSSAPAGVVVPEPNARWLVAATACCACAYRRLRSPAATDNRPISGRNAAWFRPVPKGFG